ncbi:DUF2628 domain-containing protein [Rhizobium binxianense]
MTASYVFLTPPGGTDAMRDETRTIRDGFTFVGFLFPWLWLLAHRLWLPAIAAFLLQAIGSALMDETGLGVAGAAILLGTSLLTGLEGQNLRIRNLAARGWEVDALVTADSLGTAEDIYFSTYETESGTGREPSPEWKPAPHTHNGHPTSLGLFGFDGGRS